jgi:chromosome partitioning protein
VSSRPHVIVLGNEKGGSGKSTTALHLIVALLRQGKTVASLDLDARQGTLTRYMENRRAYVAERGLRLPMPEHESLHRSEADSRREAEAEERALVEAAFARHAAKDFIVCDTPGSDTHLSRLAHTRADTLITPLNDSFVDLDLLARVTRDGKKILGPSIYSQLVWEQRLARAKTGARPIDWIVMRNRLSHTQARNKRDVGRLLGDLARRIGFRLAPGFGERVIFRELFVQGLTLLDLRESGTALSMSHVAAREEVRALLETIAIPGLAARVA